MASVIASLVSSTSSSSCKYVLSPTCYPSWRSPHRDCIETKRTFTGHTTTWTSHGATRLCITDDHHPQATCIAYFPPLNPLLTSHEPPPYNVRNASLVTSTKRFVTIATPGDDIVRTSLGDPLTNPYSAIEMFTTPYGLILRTLNEPCYYFLSHPLHSPSPLFLPEDHTLVHSFPDLPLVVTRDCSLLTIWSCIPTASPTPQLFPISGYETLISAPDLNLTQLYQTSVHPTHPVSAFLSHDAHGLLVLCLVSDSILTGLSINQTDVTSYEITPSFRIRDVTSAVPVLAIRRLHTCLDALVRHADGSLSLFMGRNRLCAVHLSGSSPSLLSSNFTLTQPVADEFSCIDTEGNVARFSMLQTCFSSPLVNHCLAAVTFAFENAGAITRTAALYHALLSARANFFSANSSPPANHVEWSIFENALLRATPTSAKPSATSSDTMDIEVTDILSETIDDAPSDADWKMLLECENHFNDISSRPFGRTPSQVLRPMQDASAPSLTDISIPHAEILKQVLNALHLLYEDRKLSVLSRHTCHQLANLNYRLASLLGDFSFIDHYRRDFPELVDIPVKKPTNSFDGEVHVVPSIMEFLSTKLSSDAPNTALYPDLSSSPCLDCNQDLQLTASWHRESPFELTRRVLNYFDQLFGDESVGVKIETRYERILLAMVRDNVTPAVVDAMPFGVSLPLRDALWYCRQHPNSAWPNAAFALIGREDLFNVVDFDSDRQQFRQDNLNLVQESRALLQIYAAAASMDDSTEVAAVEEEKPEVDSSGSQKNEKPYLDDKGDGCDLQGAIFRLRFGSDQRIEEVRRILRSTDFTIMAPVQKTLQDESGEFDMLAHQKGKLELLLRKRFAATVGRGAFTLRTYVPTDPTKPLSAPKICMTGRLLSQTGPKLTYTPTEPSSLQWGEFHNGVAAGLRIVAADVNRESETGQILTRSWIVNHRPSDMAGSATHAGMLLALGLGGYLPVLRKTDYYQYLIPRHELTAIGLMLGLSAGNVGSSDEKITKMLCLHIRPFNVTGFAVPDFHISMNVQTAALLGLGFLHMGSCEHFLLEGLFAELGHRLKPGDVVDDREGLVLAAGFAIGLICLGHGSSAFDAADRSQIDRLILFANGGSTDDRKVPNGHVEHESVKLNEISNQSASTAPLADSETSRVLEGKYVNTDVVSPGALMALTLIYMKTNDRRLAERLIIPDTLFSLDRARPDHVYLRLLARSLIMWDEIEPTDAWICKSIPKLLLPVNEKNDPFDLQGLAKLGYVGLEHQIDLSGALAARGFAVAGACTAIALKYAGTGDAAAIDLLTRECEAFERALLTKWKERDSMEYVYSTGLCCAALGVAIVAAGSGDLDVFRLLRRLRKRCGPSEGIKRYGSHIATHLAIGFLFLGGGCQTFGTSNLAVVGLLCAIYPQFPRKIEDNQYHLQALRHLYVLAVEPRCVETRDVDMGTGCCVDVEVRLKNGKVLQKRSPCIVPEAGLVEDIKVVSERYLSTCVPINRAVPGRGWYSSSRGQVLFVKRKSGHLPVSADPKGSKGILARSLNRPKPGDGYDESYYNQIGHLVKAFSADPEILAFVKYFCNPDRNEEDGGLDQSNVGSEKANRYVEMLYECLSNDKPDAVKVYLEVEQAAEAVKQGDGYAGAGAVDSLVLAEGYMLSRQVDEGCFVRRDFLAGVLMNVRGAVLKRDVRQKLLSYVVSGGKEWGGDADDERRRRLYRELGVAIRLSRIPAVSGLADLSEWARKSVGEGLGGDGGGMVTDDGDSMYDLMDDGRMTGVNDCAVEALLDALEMDDTTSC